MGGMLEVGVGWGTGTLDCFCGSDLKIKNSAEKEKLQTRFQ